MTDQRLRITRRLPAQLDEQYAVDTLLAATGAQASLYRVTERTTGEQRLVKVYRGAHEFDEIAHALLAVASPDHVVSLFDFGVADGHAYEVLEWCEHGSLADLMASGTSFDVHEVARELCDALEHVQSLRSPEHPGVELVHRDIKPSNILVRSVEPLDLALADFGLVRVVSQTVHFTAFRGTHSYAAPESLTVVTAASDWWAVGMVMAEIAGGRHPFSNDLGPMSLHEIQFHLAQHRVDLEAVGDERVRLACRGLLTRNHRRRWGARELRDWLGGADPAVRDEEPVEIHSGPTVTIGGERFDSAEQLALAFQQRWSESIERLFFQPDAELRTELEIFARERGLSRVIDLLGDAVANPVRQFCRLLMELHLGLAPRFGPEQLLLTPEALGGLARIAAEVDGGDSHQVAAQSVRDRLVEVEHHQVLSLWRHLPGMDRAADIERQWSDAQSSFRQRAAALPRDIASGLDADLAKWTLLEWVADPDLASRRSARLRRGHRTSIMREVPWWADLEHAGRTDPAARLLSVVLASSAQHVGTEARAERRALAVSRRLQRFRDRADRSRRLLLISAVVFAVAALGLFDVAGRASASVRFFRSIAWFSDWIEAWPVGPSGVFAAAAIGTGDPGVQRALGMFAVAGMIAAVVLAGAIPQHLDAGRRWRELTVGTPVVIAGSVVVVAAYLPLVIAAVMTVLVAIVIIGVALYVIGVLLR